MPTVDIDAVYLILQRQISNIYFLINILRRERYIDFPNGSEFTYLLT